MPHELQIKKTIVWKCHLILHNSDEPFLDQVVTCDEKWIVYDNQIVYDQLSGWTEKKLQSTSQTQTFRKKCHDYCLVVCCRSDPLQLSESQQTHYI